MKALLEVINQSLAEDTPRLMYADWLEENQVDLARAEFIRLQVYGLRPWRQEFLLSTNHYKWWTPVIPRDCKFVRGFPYGLTMLRTLVFKPGVPELTDRLTNLHALYPTIQRVDVPNMKPWCVDSSVFTWHDDRNAPLAMAYAYVPRFVYTRLQKTYTTAPDAREDLELTIGDIL